MNTSSISASWRRVAVLLLLSAAAASANLKPGDKLPALSQFGLEGVPPAIEGKVVLLDFWASWCGPCKQSFPVLDKLHADFKDRGLVVLGVSVDDKAESMQKFLKGTPVAFATVRDAAHALVSHAGVEAMPSSILIGRDGKVVAVHRGFKGKATGDELRKEIESLLAQPAVTK